MKKLTIEHLAPYLPYKIKIKWFRKDDNSFQLSYLTISDYPFLTKQLFKPILRPLSDLTKEEWKDKLGMRLFELDMQTYILSGEMNGVPFWVGQKLFEWHFDVFGLIKKGLVIDINTLDAKS